MKMLKIDTGYTRGYLLKSEFHEKSMKFFPNHDLRGGGFVGLIWDFQLMIAYKVQTWGPDTAIDRTLSGIFAFVFRTFLRFPSQYPFWPTDPAKKLTNKILNE